jgi:tubulin-specific chaperone D
MTQQLNKTDLFRHPGQDTIVRWSAAKCISRLSSHLPLAFADQIAEAVIAIFSRDVLPIPGSTTAVDLTAVKEGAWHGACLAVAELARRGVLTRERLDELVPWLLRVGS